MNQPTSSKVLASALGALFTLVPVQASLLVDGGFETPYTYDIYDNGREAGEVVGAWDVVSGTVDLVASADLSPFEGTQSLDLSGTGVGRISQSVTTAPGVTYQLTFQLAGNVTGLLMSDDSQPIKQLEVIWNGSVVDTLSFDITGHTQTSMGWELRTFNVTATGTTSTLAFASLTDSIYGPVIDDVGLNPVPEPGLAAFVGALGLVAFGVHRRRNR